MIKFQSTPPGWEATTDGIIVDSELMISIHASRVGGDKDGNPLPLPNDISIHASRVGGDQYAQIFTRLFRAISIHASRVGGDSNRGKHGNSSSISIHASRVGGDDDPAKSKSIALNFNPRLPGGRRR